MKKASVFIALLVSFYTVSFASGNYAPALSDLADHAITQYFADSNTALESVKVDTVNRTKTSSHEYLVEGIAQAQAPHAEEGQMADYHCGVFIKRVSGEWLVEQTDCEVLPPWDH
jgi:hypothetical protein